MDGFNVSYAGAAGAGLLSFLSPCVLPLVPPYLCFLGGLSLEELTATDAREARGRHVFVASIAFVLGFSTVFVALGATASTIGQTIAENLDILVPVAGIVVILLGLHFLGVFRIGLLNRDVRFHPQARPFGVIGAYVVGLAFAFGWTPCVGPVLAAVLFVAGTEDSMWQGASLLGAYSLGLGIPFLVAALAARPFMRFMQRFRNHLRKIEITMGALLVGTGVLFITGSMADIAFWILETFPALGTIG